MLDDLLAPTPHPSRCLSFHAGDVAQDLDLSVNMSHTGTFTVLNLDAAGFRRPIRVGLDLSAASQVSRGTMCTCQ